MRMRSMGDGGELHRTQRSVAALDAAAADANGRVSGSNSIASDAAGVAKEGMSLDAGGDAMKAYTTGRSSSSAEKGAMRRDGEENDKEDRPGSSAGVMGWDEKSGRMRLDG